MRAAPQIGAAPCGIRTTARTNQVMVGFMFVVLFSYIALAIKYLVVRHGVGGLFSSRFIRHPHLTFETSQAPHRSPR
jgi:hypothetical protein